MAKVKLTAADWAIIITAVQRGESTVRDLSDQFKVSKQAIHEGLRKRGVVKASRVHEVAAEADDASTALHKKKVAEAHAIAARYSKYNDLIVQLTIKKIMDGNQLPAGLAGANADVLTLKNAMAIVRTGRIEAWSISKIEEMLEQSEELAALNVGEYSEEEIAAIRQGNEEAYNESKEELDSVDLSAIGQGDDDHDDSMYGDGTGDDDDDDDGLPLVEIPDDDDA